MRHPFEVIICEQTTLRSEDRAEDLQRPTDSSSRRSFLQRLAAGAAGIIGLVVGGKVKAKEAIAAEIGVEQVADRRTMPSHDRGGSWHGGGGRYTTQAIGEEGGYYRPPYRQPPQYTTYALGEEGAGSWPPRHWPPRYHRPPRYTTYALGEEGAGWPRPPRYTTYALGEEG